MKKEEILKQFKESNPKLLKLSSEILITESFEKCSTGDDEIIVYDPPLLEIDVKHPFIFDKRLIPSEFNGIKIREFTTDKFPKEFPSVNAALPLEDWYSPEWYVKFVDKHLSLISKKIQIPNLTRAEALDALTGGIEKHINWGVKLREERIEKEKENITFFTKLLYSVKQAFLLSDVYKNFKQNEWYYSVTATKLEKNKPLIVGFNWGAEKTYKYNPQCEYPFTLFEGLYDELGSLKRVIPLFHEYYTKALFGVQTNFCFFRSKKESQISYNDLTLCKSLFEKYLDYVNPSVIISFSAKLRNYFVENNLVTDKKSLYIKFLKGQLEIIKATYKTKSGKIIDFIYLPHPNTPVSNEERIKAWKFCFNNNELTHYKKGS